METQQSIRVPRAEESIALGHREEFRDSMNELGTACKMFLTLSADNKVDSPSGVFGNSVTRADRAAMAFPMTPRPGELELGNLRRNISALESLLDSRDRVALAVSRASDDLSETGSKATEHIDQVLVILARNILQQFAREGLYDG